MARLQDPIHDSIQTPLHRGPDFETMTDDEILAHLSRDETEDKYAVQHLAPDGMMYQWFRCEVFGKPDYNRIAEAEQRGWRPVPAKRHEGRFMAPGTDGPTILDGMQLFELPSRVVRLKRQLASEAAQAKVRDMNDQLIYSPPGTGPRVPHERVPGPSRVRRQAGAMDLVVE